MILPPPVEPGDEVAVIAPSSQKPNSVVERGVTRLRETFDVDPVVYPSVTSTNQLSPAERAAELHDTFRSDRTAVFPVTGGEDGMRLLRHLDPSILRHNPTRFFGISDNTHVHLLLSAAGVVSYYGCQFVPGLACDDWLPAYTKRYLERALFQTSIGEVAPAARWTDDTFDVEDNPVREWKPNPGWEWHFSTNEVVTGALWGGCLTVLEHVLAVDQFEPAPARDGEYVLAIETSGLVPKPYSVKAVLRCLGERGLLDDVAALMVGRPKTSGRHRDPVRHRYRRGQRKAILKAVQEYVSDPKILFDLDFGHTDPQIPIPIGGHVRLDPETRSVCFRSGDELTTRSRSE